MGETPAPTSTLKLSLLHGHIVQTPKCNLFCTFVLCLSLNGGVRAWHNKVDMSRALSLTLDDRWLPKSVLCLREYNL